MRYNKHTSNYTRPIFVNIHSISSINYALNHLNLSRKHVQLHLTSHIAYTALCSTVTRQKSRWYRSSQCDDLCDPSVEQARDPQTIINMLTIRVQHYKPSTLSLKYVFTTNIWPNYNNKKLSYRRDSGCSPQPKSII